MHTAGKVFVKTYLKAISFSLLAKTFFPNMWNFPIVIFLSNRSGKFKLLDLQGDPPLPQFPHLVGYPNLPMRKTLRVVGLLTVMIFFQSKKSYSM